MPTGGSMASTTQQPNSEEDVHVDIESSVTRGAVPNDIGFSSAQWHQVGQATKEATIEKGLSWDRRHHNHETGSLHLSSPSSNWRSATAEIAYTEGESLAKQAAECRARAQQYSDIEAMQHYSSGACFPSQMMEGYVMFVLVPVVTAPSEAPCHLPTIPISSAAVCQLPVLPIPEPQQYLFGDQHIPQLSAGTHEVSMGMKSASNSEDSMGRTTVMWRNIPNNYSRDDLLELLSFQGFAGSYDFFYSPVDFTSNSLVGYAFINLVSCQEANRFLSHFHGFRQWSLMSDKISEVVWSDPLQGLDAHIARYRNSGVMHSAIEDAKKPVVFKDGHRVTFPEPTKRIRAPHLKTCRPSKK